MPVTAKLSKAFYDKFGDEATNELVNWLNAVDDSYRADLRELNELNFARFDAKLEQRIAEVRADIKAGLLELRADMNARFAQSDAKLERRLGELSDQSAERLRKAEIRLAALTIAWVPVALGIFEFVFRR